jgi:hypothetical protein
MSRDFASLVQQALVQKLRPTNSSVRDLSEAGPVCRSGQRFDAECPGRISF